MRVGLVVYGSLDYISGGYLYARKLVEHLRNFGDEVHVVSLPVHRYFNNLLQNIDVELLDRFLRLPVDVLVQDGLCHSSLFQLNRWLRGRVGYPVVALVHNPASYIQPGALRCRVERRYLATPDAFIFSSAQVKKAVESLGGKAPSIVAYPGADHISPVISDREIADRAQEPGALRLIFLGAVARHKGLHTLIDALDSLPGGDFFLTVTGPVTDKGYARIVRNQAERGTLAGKVEFTGALAGEALENRLRLSHLMAIPSAYEGFGIAYLEGMGFGLPAIATSRGGAVELVTDGIDGFLVSPGDVAGLARHIEALGSNRNKLAGMAICARRRYLSHPAWNLTVSRIRAFLAGLCR